MQIQAFSAGNVQQAGAQTGNAARQNTAAVTQTMSNTAEQVGGLQQKAIAATGPAEKQSPTMQEDVNQAVLKMNDTLQSLSQKLEFSVDEESDAFVVKIVDKETKEVIRQIPSEEMLNLSKALDKLQGLLIKDVA